jgi:hypothetical protein
MAGKSAFSAAKTEEFFNALRFAHTERAKKERFIQYLTSIYEGDEAAQRTISQMNLGAERFITNIPRHNKLSYGRADTQTETVIIEWEADLRKMGEHAKHQLAEYLTGNWKSGNYILDNGKRFGMMTAIGASHGQIRHSELRFH